MSLTSRHYRLALIDRVLRAAFTGGSTARVWSSAQLADRYEDEEGEEVSVRTIGRDTNWMKDMGAPIEYDPSRKGYYYTDLSWRIPAMSLSQADLFAILVADRALASYRNTPFYKALKDVFRRLTDLLPENVSLSSQDLVDDMTVITEPVTRIADEVWETVRDAMRDRRSLVIHYLKPTYSEPMIRIVDPYHVIGHRGEWYLLAYSQRDKNIRVYALGRVKRAKLRPETFTVSQVFRVENHIDPSFGIFASEDFVEVSVRFSGEAASKIPERTWHPEQKVTKHKDGSITVRFRTNQQSQVVFWVSQWGPEAEILSPPDLRARAADWFRRTAESYR